MQLERSCVFSGPSLGQYVFHPSITAYPPARRGSMIGAVSAGYHRIGIVDGSIDETDQLTATEIVEALRARPIELFGGASMGAIHAAELGAAGMHGLGHVFRLFRRRAVQDRDEVYVLHAPREFRYRCLTIPLINIRFTLRRLRRNGWLDSTQEGAIARFMKEVPWFERDWESLGKVVEIVLGYQQHESLTRRFRALYRDVKREDALLVVSKLHSKREY